MAKFSQKVMGKEVGQAAVYAKPHSMSGGPMVTKKMEVAKLIMFKVRRDGIKGWKAFDYAFENIWDEYESKVVEAYGKDFSATIENQFKDI